MRPGRIDRRARALALLPAAAWYCLIWGFSAQTAAVSGGLSDGLLYRLLERLSPAFAAAAEPTRTAAVELLSFFERKAAHMFLYFVLALLVYFGICFFLRQARFRSGVTALACAVLAGLDEYHQTMVPGRSGELRDVLVDLCGAGLALGFLALPYLAKWGRRSLSFPLPALVPAALCGLCLLFALRLPAAGEGLPVWAQARFPPSPAAGPEGLAGLYPALRDAAYLAACGVTGVCLPAAGLLAGLHRRRLPWLCAAAVAGAAALSWSGGAALPLAAAGAAVLGILGMLSLWWLAAAFAPFQISR
mgnify:CR=1 FL=1